MSYSSLARLVQSFESGGNYTAQNPSSSASGAYQFTTPTWQQYASQLGIDLSRYPTAASAPPAVQDAVFQQAVSQVGLEPWTCPGCNSRLSSYLAANPSTADLPVSATSSSDATPSYIVPPGYGQPGLTTNPLDPGANPGGIGPGTLGFWADLWELVTRAGVFAFGMFLVLLALFALLWRSQTVQTTARTVGAFAE